MDIQVDMFEVQLGASILLQFKIGDDRTVTVLADGGTKGGGYGDDHVLEKLKEVLPILDADAPPRIDLLIGTHYDLDHLNRLVPVIEAYEIGEAWMPPIANDSKQPAADWSDIRESNLLGTQFAGEDGNEQLRQYLSAKKDIIERVSAVRKLLEREGDDLRITSVRPFLTDAIREVQDDGGVGEEYFLKVCEESVTWGADGRDHACRDVRPPSHFGGASENYFKMSSFHDISRFTSMDGTLLRSGKNQARSLSYIEKSAAEDALTASSLKKVVDALESKGVSTRYEHIADGVPSYHAWSEADQRFVHTKSAEGLTITLLGPSRGLISKYWERLPVGEYIAFALQSKLPVESITPQNELSYAMIFTCDGQGVLISGDTGFVDFLPIDRPFDAGGFHPKLIQALEVPLPVVQVAHHGGHNKYFYHAMEAANYPVAPGMNYLLLSHEEHSKSRPSKVFSDFITRLNLEQSRIQILFTSQPLKTRAANFRPLIAPRAPPNVSSNRGDVRLRYDGGVWSIVKHAIAYG